MSLCHYVRALLLGRLLTAGSGFVSSFPFGNWETYTQMSNQAILISLAGSIVAVARAVVLLVLSRS